MRRLIAVALMMTLCLTGCKNAGNASEAAAVQKRTEILAAGGISVTADIVADYGERVYEYTLGCDYVYQGTSSVNVIKPDIIAGITATVEYGKTALSFDELNIDTGVIAGSELTPLGALTAMSDAWCSGYISNSCFETYDGVECLYVSYLVGYDNDELEYRTWFDKLSLNPVRGEVVSDGRVVITLTYK